MNERPVRKSVRLKCYDYAQNGAYFVTFCVQDKRCLLGDAAGKNGAGQMVERWLHEIENKFPGVALDYYAVMPNHLHMILFLPGNAGGHAGPPLPPNQNRTVGAALCGGPNNTSSPTPSLPMVMDWFKTMSTNAYIRGVKAGVYPRFEKRLWQRNYYEHVIRCETELYEVRKYIEENPMRWREDELYMA